MPNIFYKWGDSGSLSTAQGSQSGTLQASAAVTIVMHLKTFFPNMWSGGGYSVRVGCNFETQGDYVGRFRLHNSLGTSQDYQVTWEYVTS